MLGGLFISAGDHLFHVRTGVLRHHWLPQWDGQSLSVIPQFVVAAALMAEVARRLPGTDRQRRPGGLVVIAELAAFFAAYALTGWIGVTHPLVCGMVLLIAFVARLAVEPEPGTVVLLGVLIALGGCVGEALVSRTGLFEYVAPDVAGVPLWLFPLYLHGAPAVLATARLLLPASGRAARSEVDDGLGPIDDLVERQRPRPGAEVLPAAVADDHHDDAPVDRFGALGGAGGDGA